MSNSTIFPVNTTLLNSKFDGYKLCTLDAESSLKSHDLPSPGATQSTVSVGISAPLTFEEVQSRIRHNHLSTGSSAGSFAYVDSAGTLIIIRIDETARDVVFAPVFEIPKDRHTAGGFQTDGLSSEYPVPISLNEELWLVGDGQRSLYLVSAIPRSPGILIASYEYSYSSQTVSPPIRLHSAVLTNHTQTITAVISHRAYIVESGAGTSRDTSADRIQFDVACISLAVPDHPLHNIRPVEVRWTRRGTSVPSHVAYDAPSSSHLILGGSRYSSLFGQDPMTGGAYQPPADEIAPIPRAGESLDVEMTAVDSTSGITLPPAPPPYSWTQTSDSVTIAFPLPATTPSSAIKVAIAAKNLSLLVHRPILSQSQFPFPRYQAKEWWADIDASASFWTWDKEGDRQKGEDGPPTVGLLTLHLEKKHEGTRWSHVFYSVDIQPASTAPEEDVEVPETIDPSEMWHIRESLGKYTAALSEGKDVGGGGLGMGTGVSSLGQGEYDEEVDESAGIPVMLTWVGEMGGDSHAPPKHTTEMNLLSMQFPKSNLSGHGIPSLVIKHDIDGLLVDPPISTPNSSSTISSTAWTHSSTYPALSFVLASKRDIRFTYHIDSRAVFAFEGSSRMLTASSNVYIYRGAISSKARIAQQAVLKIGGGDAGALLGVGEMVSSGNGGEVLVICLCEKKLIVASGVV
ncbi:hypothetical protein FRB96_003610 [Tulasnella sp. 330]|nr:hypothetical protein FRB96_003610 [Tulasnella sp. 330]